MDNAKEYERQIESLKQSGIILDDLLPSSDAELYDSEEIIAILEAAYNFEYDEDADILYYIDELGEQHKAPDLSFGVSEAAEWLSDKLPQPVNDFDQGGNVRKSEEAKSIYSLICIGVTLKCFKDEISDVFKHYDFSGMQFKSDYGDYESMTSYLKTYQDLNSARINTIISSAGIRISRVSEKKDAYWRISLSAEEISEYSKVSRSIKNIILEYEMNKSLSPGKIKQLSKVERLTTIDKRDREIEKIINECAIPTIYRISKFNSERLPAATKRKIFLSARKVANTAVLESKLVGLEANEVYDSVFSKRTRDLTRMAVTTLRHNEIAKFKNDPNSYVLRKKA